MQAFWPLTARDVARITGGTLAGDPGALGLRLLTDSRVGVRPGDLFVGLAGPHFDGGRFASGVLARGAALAVVSPRFEGSLTGAVAADGGQAVVTVEDPLAALQALAAAARRSFAGTVVAVTGSNGKTTVKDMLTAALGQELRVTSSPLSYNSQVGVALSLLGLDPRAAVAVVECGISAPGEMDALAAMVRPDRGILTMIGDAHREGLGSREGTAREKCRLFRRIGAEGWVLVGEREALGQEALAGLGAGGGGAPRVVTVGGEGADFILTEGAEAGGGPVLARGEVRVPLALAEALPHWIEDGALAAAAALLLGASPEGIAAGLAAWHPAPMRLEMSTTPRGVLLINDAYTADPVSMEAALETLVRERGSRAGGGGRAVAVLGGMAQLGVARQQAHAGVGRRVVELGIDRLVGVGVGGAEIAAAAREAGMAAAAIATVGDVTEAAAELEEHCRPGDRVLLKASRPERLERIAELLSDAVAPARLHVDLGRVVANYRAIRKAVEQEDGTGAAVMAVVKSFGYGLDAVRIARALEHAGADAFAVAYADEGVRLRDQGVTAPILVQNILSREVDKVVRHGLAAQVWTGEQVAWLAREAERQRRAVRVHLKVDTGMGRSGAFPAEVPELARAIRASEWLMLEGLATHFAAAEDPAEDAFTREQIRRFNAVRAALAASGITVPWVHAAASAAIARFPEAHYTMVRSGLALFGYAEVEGGRVPLPQLPVLRLTTRVIAVKEIPPGHTVGYGRTFTAEGPREIAVVALGYNDGYPRSLSNRGWMAVRGRRCPVVGRVSMDVATLDVTDLGGQVRPGDEVVVFGPAPGEPSLTDLARLAGTIPYELLTRLSPRVRRIFWHGEVG